MIGILLQDEKVPGVHIAFGDPYGSQTHADWKSRTHVDVLTRECDVWIDDEQVIADGRSVLVLGRLDCGLDRGLRLTEFGFVNWLSAIPNRQPIDNRLSVESAIRSLQSEYRYSRIASLRQ